MSLGVVSCASARVVCRECGSTIEAGEPRFGREEGHAELRRVRWRHVACAAQALPEGLLRALEFGGWRAVPDDEHEELRALIENTIAARRAILGTTSSTGSGPTEARAARSNSAMAAAAVLEPAHQSDSLDPARARAWVFADALQAQGDPRGELLALELAAEHTADPLQARALRREHHECWLRHQPGLTANAALRLRWIGGFLLGGYPKHQHELHRLFASPAATTLTRARVDFCTHEELARMVAVATAHACPITVVDLPNSRSSDLRALADLDQLQLLRVGDRFDVEQLGACTGVRGLGLVGGERVDLASLTAFAATLELLELRNSSGAGVTPRPLADASSDHQDLALPKLQHLTLAGVRFEGAPELLRGVTNLRSLRLPDSPVRELGPITQLGDLRELMIVPGKLRVMSELAVLVELERLALTGSKVGELEELAGLRACEHLALSATRTTRLEPLAALPRLRSLSFDGGDLRRTSGLEALAGLEQLTLAKLANLDLASLARFDRLHTLVLDPGGRRPRSVEQLAALPQLRRLSIPIELLDELAAPARTLASIEVLELTGESMPALERIAALPHLHRLLLPGRDPTLVAQLAAALPEVALFTDVAPRDRLGHRDPFDWRQVEWPHAGMRWSGRSR